MNGHSLSRSGSSIPYARSACWTDFVMPSFGSVRVPSRSNSMMWFMYGLLYSLQCVSSKKLRFSFALPRSASARKNCVFPRCRASPYKDEKLKSRLRASTTRLFSFSSSHCSLLTVIISHFMKKRKMAFIWPSSFLFLFFSFYL